MPLSLQFVALIGLALLILWFIRVDINENRRLARRNAQLHRELLHAKAKVDAMRQNSISGFNARADLHSVS